jgi:hypothetical protein
LNGGKTVKFPWRPMCDICHSDCLLLYGPLTEEERSNGDI